MSKKDIDIVEFYKASLARELQILKDAVDAHKAGNKQLMTNKFNELCVLQEQVLHVEAEIEADEIIENAQRNARATLKARLKSDIQARQNKNENGEGD
jgi:hypothetical protein